LPQTLLRLGLFILHNSKQKIMKHYKPFLASTKQEIIKRAERINTEMHEYATQTFQEEDNDILSYDDCCIQFLIMKLAEKEYADHCEANYVFTNYK
jgi:uncharacterized membrane protein